MNNLEAAGLGCVIALALWKGTKERWLLTVLGMLIVLATWKYTKEDDVWTRVFFWSVCGVVLELGAIVLRRWDNYVAKSKSTENAIDPWPLQCSGIDDVYPAHWIGPNEPYRFLDANGTVVNFPDTTGDSGVICLDCIRNAHMELELAKAPTHGQKKIDLSEVQRFLFGE